jgi:hypothetical protein
MVAQNGYHYIRTEKGWRLEHHVVAEKSLGRSVDTKTERVTFKDRDRHNLSPDNIEVVPKGKPSVEARKAALLARKEELEAQLAELEEAQ